ncbi:MAG: MerR family transcriptional regulator [Clostridia bacterium]
MYTIKRISDLVGIGPQTIRYYEEKGVLNPERNDQSGYRYYTVWDYGMLIHVRKYLKYGCSVSEAAELLNTGSVESTIEMAERKATDLEKEIVEKVHILNNLRTLKGQLANLSADLGQCQIVQRPAMYRMENMQDITFSADPQIHRLTQEWLSMMPFVYNTIRYSLKDVCDDTEHRCSALGILERDAQVWKIQESQYVKYYPERLCVHTVIGGDGFDKMLPLSKRIHGALDYLRENGLTLTGDVITRMDIMSASARGYCTYQNAWFPID